MIMRAHYIVAESPDTPDKFEKDMATADTTGYGSRGFVIVDQCSNVTGPACDYPFSIMISTVLVLGSNNP